MSSKETIGVMYTYIEMEKRRAHLVPPTKEREKIVERLARLKEKGDFHRPPNFLDT